MNNLQQQICSVTKELQPFYHKGAFQDIFCWSDLYDLLNNTPFINYERFNVIGGDLSPIRPELVAEWQTDKSIIGPQRVQRYIDNYVCYLTDCSRVNKKINDICHFLENVNKISCDAHIFFSVKKMQTTKDGFGMHFDQSHNLIIQIEGKTQFTVEDKFDITLEPGDCVYAPAGVWHKAVSLDNRLSISFPMNPNHKTLQERTWLCM